MDLNSLSSILLIRLRSLGDTVLMTPVISALHRWRPSLQIDALVERPFAPILNHNPKLTRVIEVEARDAVPWHRRLESLACLRQQSYDLVINLHGGPTSLLYTLLARRRCTLGSESFRYSWVYGRRAPAAAHIWGRTKLHTIENQLAPLKWLGIPVEPIPHPELYIADAERLRMDTRLMDSGLSGRPFVLIHPTATLFTKQWDLRKFGRLVATITRDFQLPVALTVSPAERAVVPPIRSAAQTPFIVFDDLSLAELAALIERATLFVGCDSGPTHMAAALGKKIVVIFGSSNADAWRPWRTAHELVRSDLPCMPCPGYRCAVFGDPKCILEISAETVAAAVHRLLKEKPAGDFLEVASC